MRTERQRTGDAAEDLVAELLADAGWVVLGRRVRVGRAELDLLAIDPGPPRTLVVVEVRYRASRDFGTAEETVDARKGRRLRIAGHAWLDRSLAGHPPGVGAAPGRAAPRASPATGAAAGLGEHILRWRLPLRVDLVAVEPSDGRPDASRASPAGRTIRHHRGVF